MQRYEVQGYSQSITYDNGISMRLVKGCQIKGHILVDDWDD